MDYTVFIARLLLLPILLAVCAWGVWQYFAKRVKITVRLRFLRCGGSTGAMLPSPANPDICQRGILSTQRVPTPS
jgi:hypothetical protein